MNLDKIRLKAFFTSLKTASVV